MKGWEVKVRMGDACKGAAVGLNYDTSTLRMKVTDSMGVNHECDVDLPGAERLYEEMGRALRVLRDWAKKRRLDAKRAARAGGGT